MRRAVPCIVLSAFVAAGCNGAAPPDAASASTVVESNAVVVAVVDGDTIDVSIDGATERVRLIGIDTPETKKPDTPVECFGPEATAFTAKLLPTATPVRLERDVEGRDAYDRLLAYVFRATDGLFVNLAIVESGYAVPLPFEPNTAHAAEFAAAARSADSAALGLWSHCNG